MVFLLFAPLTFVVLRLSVRWRWKTVLIASLIVGLIAESILDMWTARVS